MKKKKGFTLIELLAVIVILAIIALIATPLVLNAIKNAQKGAAERSAENYVSAVETAVAASLLGNNKIEDGLYTINSDGNITKGDNIYTIEVSGNKPIQGIVKIENGQVVKSSQTKLTIGDYQLSYDNNNKIVANAVGTSKPCTIVSGDGTNVGDEITCGTENFYVMSNDGNNITMLAKYNLKVGRIYTTLDDYTEISTTEEGYGLQDSEMIGLKFNESFEPIFPWKGTVAFSESRYWTETPDTDGGTLLTKYGTEYPADVYDENSNLYQYVENYETYLKGNGVSSAATQLMSYEQAVSLGCDPETEACISEFGGEPLGGTAPSWVYSTSYWLGSADGSGSVGVVIFIGDFRSGVFSRGSSGVRPVITISVNEIK